LFSFQVTFEVDARQQYLNLLGYSHSSVKEDVNEALRKSKDLKCDEEDCHADAFSEHVS
jgi:hypothetical protein